MRGKYHIHRVVALMAWPFNDIIYSIFRSIIFYYLLAVLVTYLYILYILHVIYFMCYL